MRNTLIASLVPAFLMLTAGSALAAPHCKPCPYSCSDVGLGHRDCSETTASRGLCCLDLSSKGMALALEQERALAQSGSAPAARTQETCPPGFKPSEQKCTKKERKHGCQDMRLPGGLGCVKR